MYTRLFIVLMFVLCFFGGLSSTILYYGFDPSERPILAVTVMSLSIYLTIGSSLGLILLGIKKVIRMGYIYPMDAFRSFRHGLLSTLLIMGMYLLALYDSLHILTSFLLICIVFLLELILTKMEDS